MKRRRPSFWMLFTGITCFVVLGGVALFLAVGELRTSNWPHAEGQIVDSEVTYEPRRNSSGDTWYDRTYAPVVEFTVDGRTYRFTSRMATGEPPDLGGTVDVVYHPDDPGRASIAGNVGWVPWFLGGMGHSSVCCSVLSGYCCADPPRISESGHPGADGTSPCRIGIRQGLATVVPMTRTASWEGRTGDQVSPAASPASRRSRRCRRP